MEIVYYPNMFMDSDHLLKSLLLTWGKVKTIVPPSQKEYIDAYLAGDIKNETHYPLETYKQIYDAAGTDILDFMVISDDERLRASEKMFDLIVNWNKDTGFYDDLKINSLDDLMGKTVEWYWFLHEKLEEELVGLMLEEQLVVNWALGEIVGYQEVGKSYMSIIAEEIKSSRKTRLITDDEFFVASKSGLNLDRLSEKTDKNQYVLISVAIPKVFIDEKTTAMLTWKEITKIRKELLPYAEPFYKEVEEYQHKINSLTQQGQDDEAFNTFCEFCERVAKSFRPFSKETGKILRVVTQSDAIGLLNGIVFPTLKLLHPDPNLAKICDTLAVSSTAGKYTLKSMFEFSGFEYLENLNRALNIERFKKTMTCLIPKSLKK